MHCKKLIFPFLPDIAFAKEAIGMDMIQEASNENFVADTEQNDCHMVSTRLERTARSDGHQSTVALRAELVFVTVKVEQGRDSQYHLEKESSQKQQRWLGRNACSDGIEGEDTIVVVGVVQKL
eukprot:147866_1